MRRRQTQFWIALLALLLVGVSPLLFAADEQAASSEPAPAGASDSTPKVRVATLVYAGDKTSVCFADGFLRTVANLTQIQVETSFVSVNLASDDLYQYPLVIMTGQDAFSISDDEVERLKAYLNRGGFLLASAGCSNADWAQSFRQTLSRVMPDATLEPLSMDHPVFHTVYDLDTIRAKREGDPPIVYGITQGGRLVVLFSPLGLNDTANAGKGCCCCGGNEVREAQLINANILAYTLTH